MAKYKYVVVGEDGTIVDSKVCKENDATLLPWMQGAVNGSIELVAAKGNYALYAGDTRTALVDNDTGEEHFLDERNKFFSLLYGNIIIRMKDGDDTSNMSALRVRIANRLHPNPPPTHMARWALYRFICEEEKWQMAMSAPNNNGTPSITLF
jgi:hypothetical protein